MTVKLFHHSNYVHNKHRHVKFDCSANLGVQLTVPERVSVVEGEEQQVCVRIEDYYTIQRERDVLVSFLLDPNNTDIGKINNANNCREQQVFDNVLFLQQHWVLTLSLTMSTYLLENLWHV